MEDLDRSLRAIGQAPKNVFSGRYAHLNQPASLQTHLAKHLALPLKRAHQDSNNSPQPTCDF